MWAVGEVDIRAIADDSLVANVAFAVASFFLGFAANIFVSSMLAEKMTDAARILLYAGAPTSVALSLVCFALGWVMIWRRNGIWKQIKKESESRET